MIKALKITVLSLICLALIGVMIGFINNGFKFNFKSKLVINESYSVENIENIKINVKSLDTNILESDDEKVHVKIYSTDKNKKIDVKVENDTLTIDQKKNYSCIGLCFNSNKADIYVPKTYLGKFDIKTTSGDINSNIGTENDYNIKVTSGDIKIDNLKSLIGHATSGDLDIGSITSYINFKTKSGDIEIGNLSIDKNSKIKVTSGDVEIDKTNNIYVSTSVNSGDVHVKNNNRKAEIELVIETTSGDIDIN